MSKIAILTAILGDFDKPFDPVPQKTRREVMFHRFTDKDFPPITGLTPRLQYRIPKLFGWEMLPGYDYYIWLDGSVSFERPDCVEWFIRQLGDADIALFKHPVRRNIRQEVAHIDEHLKQGKPYITSRYKNGLHNEQLRECLADPNFKDRNLYASTAFIYRNNSKVHEAMKLWWYHQSRYFTCDQIALSYVVWKAGLKVNKINENQYKIGYLSLVSKHK